MKVSPKDKDINPDLDEQSCNSNTARKVSKYGVISSPYFPAFARHLDRIRRDTNIFPYSVRMRENTDQK